MKGQWLALSACVLLCIYGVWMTAVAFKPGNGSIPEGKTRQAPPSAPEQQNNSRPAPTVLHLSTTAALQKAAVGKEPMVKILVDAGVDLNVSVIDQLPTWEEVVSLYGEEPILYGAEEGCEHFRDQVPSSKAKIAPAGMFNTGTSAMAGYLLQNCFHPDHQDNRTQTIQWQVPWGKHLLASKRDTQGSHTFSNSDVLPVVMVRDPYFWMISQCRNSYSMRWPHRPDHCPNLIPNEFDLDRFPPLRGHETVPVTLRLGKAGAHFEVRFNSLAHVWNEWNRQYFDLSDVPRIMVRFEDLIFRPRQLIEAICTCGGGKPKNETFQYHAESYKLNSRGGHHSSTSLLTAMIKYGKDQNRRTGFSQDDLKFMAQTLDDEMMHSLRYRVVSTSPLL